ncbi:MAG: hypothetical protein AABW79_03405 [Nanoarchaeota archaeon]
MSENRELAGYLMKLFGWISGILASLAVGFAMAEGSLSVRFISVQVTAVLGWAIVILTVLNIILFFFDRQ